MRIIAGRFKGHQLINFKAGHIRPTTDRVKETIFNKLMAYIPEARVLDLYSGTGNLAFESISRGASLVEAVEQNAKSLKIISQNCEKLKIQSELKVHAMDVFQFVKKYDQRPFDVILIDPPFTQKIAHDSMVAVADSKLFDDETIVVIESSAQERIDDEYPGFYLLDRKLFGDKKVSFFKREVKDD